MGVHVKKFRGNIMGELKLKAAVSTGLFGIAHGEELATVVRKVGYALTRGTSAIEIAGDVPHEIDFTEGIEIRRIARKQEIDLNLHGSLTIPFEIPELVQYREAQDHIKKSLKSAVYGGCTYVDFHACLHFWLDMLTYVGARLEIIMCDWQGRFVSWILYESERLRNLFIEKYWDKYDSLILGEDSRAVYYRAQEESTMETNKLRQTGQIVEGEIGKTISDKHKELLKKYTIEALKKKMSSDDQKEREWYYLGKLRGDYVDACWMMANYLFLNKDPIWEEMVKLYKGLMERYDYNPADDHWFDSKVFE